MDILLHLRMQLVILVKLKNKVKNMEIDTKNVQKLLKLLEKSQATEIEIHDGDKKIKVSRQGTIAPTVAAPVAAAPQTVVAAPTVPAESVTEAPSDALCGTAIKSPMVGTFYSSANPDVPPYVKVGSRVKKGDTVCIIEAMKVMNQIESEVDGIIKDILVKNASPVEFDQPLVLVEED